MKKDNYLKKFKGNWLLAEEIINMDPFFSAIWCNCFVKELVNKGGRAYKKIVCIYRDYHMWFYYEQDDALAVGKHLVDKFYNRPQFMDEINNNIIKSSDKLASFAEKIPETFLNKLSSEKLWQLYQRHEKLHNYYYQWGWLPVAADMFGNNLTDKGKEILRQLGVKEHNINNYLNILTAPAKPSKLKEENDAFRKIGVAVQKDPSQLKTMQTLLKNFKKENSEVFGLDEHSPEYENKFNSVLKNLKNKIKPQILKQLEHHHAKYFYTKFIYTEEQGVYSLEHYFKSLVRLVNYDKNIAQSLKKEKKEFKALMLRKTKLIEKLKLNSDLKRFFNAWGGFMITKIYRRYAQLFTLYKMMFILEEIAKRIGVTLKQLKFMSSEEIERALFHDVINRKEVANRVKLLVIYLEKDFQYFYQRQEAQTIVDLIQKEDKTKVEKINGQCGCQGQAQGTVRIINVIKDMQKMKSGDVLVSISTQPDLLPAMEKAAAFITDQGGVTSHAAIVAREMNIPCIIGTKNATRVLKDGDIVEVDADAGVVRIIKK